MKTPPKYIIDLLALHKYHYTKNQWSQGYKSFSKNSRYHQIYGPSRSLGTIKPIINIINNHKDIYTSPKLPQVLKSS